MKIGKDITSEMCELLRRVDYATADLRVENELRVVLFVVEPMLKELKKNTSETNQT